MHPVRNNMMSPNALKVTQGLQKAGFDAYLVGGCVRDVFLGVTPKDFDVVTNATPEQVKETFRNCRVIGRRFKLAHVVFGREIIEVATYRGHHGDDESTQGKLARSKQDEQGQLLRDNVYGTIEEDAERRDFNINAMYYDPHSGDVIDFAGGIAAIESGTFSLIGDAEKRYREDPVRMLRAVRFAAKLNMQIAEEAARPIHEMAGLLSNIPPARLYEEVLKLLLAGSAQATYAMLQEYGLFAVLFPQVQPFLVDETSRESQFVQKVLHNTDTRINNNQRVTPAFLYAAILWYPLESHSNKLMQEAGLSAHDAFNIAMGEVLHRQCQRIMIPKRFSTVIRDIWHLQRRLPKRFGKRAYQLLEHPKFRAGYDFLLFRGEIEGGDLYELAQWWTQFQTAAPAKQKKLLSGLKNQGSKSHHRRRKPKRQQHDA
ncbi:polynucleotide adenylyltransferase PcnB [Alteromonas sediminis]|uniref:Poly(A) polymerase I n=2 Tax=Alteromonas sediminis TaxID=2259342 RepID=A0A3N5XW88_9ALTE|nr:polynucleotide adenylyltransferase PcnB [Alteromonas sediminis]